MADNKQTIAIGCDHAGFPYKARVVQLLQDRGIEVINFGTDSSDSVDYPDFVHPTAEAVSAGRADLGIVMCGSGNGVAMTANKHQSIRAALCWLPELAALARQHNDANILALPVRFIAEDVAVEIVEAFLNATFEGGRHARRVGKVACR
ncbi:MAG: ribose 5-phosphate isomerase B [Bacteroidetes bacterium]|jgi:ribose 5-phosphate isomerase B|nr:ribose 5-phosphate isomerase B [Bacteroidota bacterium]